MNNVSLAGRIASKPNLRMLNSKKICRFAIAVSKNLPEHIQEYMEKENKPTVDYIQVVAENETAECISNNCEIGDYISIIGKIQTRLFHDNKNIPRNIIEVVIDEAYFRD